MKVPYPNISSKLAVSAHMFICRKNDGTNYEYIKCQTLKPYMLINNPIRNFYDEEPNKDRNPFKRKTRIDCDKIFSTFTVSYDDLLKTKVRSDICDDLFNDLQSIFALNQW